MVITSKYMTAWNPKILLVYCYTTTIITTNQGYN